ncbi:SDR family oxidoreductase [Paenibacillus rigui]|uniref:Short-chain dehydrogenase n=1 Tax=Paenibacillus rigui TaxID=554312 RepID=A0A229UHN6_9BACL|nr:SDR family oxidoreductase [Paenibacillus rigui]OXM82924.1 short-chain dehydrogenase [Paenibacillus rigui]
MEQAHKVALVTGASSGFGLLTSIALAKQGYHVIAAMRNPDKRGLLLEQAGQAGVAGRLEVARMDVTDHETIHAVVEGMVRKHGRIDALINNAGYAAGGFVEDVPMDVWRAQLETNVFGVIAATKAVLPQMRRQGFGYIVNVSSVSGLMAFPGYAPYSTSKFAVEGFSEALRLEMKPFGVQVVLVEPGAYRTDIWHKGFESISAPEASPYRVLLKKVLDYSRQTSETAPDPGEVARRIAAILGSSRPKLRYISGKGVKLAVWGRTLLPWSWYEAVVLRFLK